MEFKIGDQVLYSFPEATNSSSMEFSGNIQSISENYIIIKNEKNIQLKVSFKNFNFLKLLNGNIRKNKHPEIYIG